MPEPGFEVAGGDAVELLQRVIESSHEKVTIAATGPITNVAQLLLTHPGVKDGIREVIFMGGSTERGNHTPTAEFNTYADPEALDVVLGSGLPVRMVGLNLTHQALANPEVVERMAAMDHVVGRTCAAWMGFFGASYNRVWEFAAPPVHDPCTIAAIIQPDLIEWREAFVAVELDGKWTRGTTVVDLHRRYPEEEPTAQVAMTLNAERYWDLVIEAVDHVGRSR
jgi:purine nucleosidase/pyrimidine-specific ribonucleoside hydrolase